jgi:hypothetical protein
LQTNTILAVIDQEIARLTEVRRLLEGSTKGTKVATKRRTLSAEARRRIAEAQRKRWAAQKKAAK